MKKKVTIIGYGVVAKEFINLILDNSNTMKRKYDFELIVTNIIGSKGMIQQPDGVKLDALLNYSSGSTGLYNYAKDNDLKMELPELSGDLLLDCTPTNIKDGEPGLSYLLTAMDLGMDIVSVSKGALVHSFSEITNSAKENGVKLKYSGATAAALPTIDMGEYSLAGCTITKIEGIFNGTSNFILTNMSKNKMTYKQALDLAKEKGIAESNSDLDVSGLDSAFKIILLSNSLLGTNATISDIKVTGIECLDLKELEEAESRNCSIKLLARAYKVNEKIHLEVSPCELNDDHPLRSVSGTNKGILFDTVEMGIICTTGGASDPRGAAMAAVKDAINIYRRDL